MRTLPFIIGMLVIGVAWSVLHRQPAKIQDRFPMETGDVTAFCENYYQWRPTQAGGGISAADLICFNAQEMKP